MAHLLSGGKFDEKTIRAVQLAERLNSDRYDDDKYPITRTVIDGPIIWEQRKLPVGDAWTWKANPEWGAE